MSYNDLYLTSAGFIQRTTITDVSDVNCNFISRTVTDRSSNTVNIDDSRGSFLLPISKTVCLIANPDASKPTCIDWVVSLSDETNNYLELPSGSYLLDNDDDMKCYAKVVLNGRTYLLNNLLPRDTYSCDRVSVPNRINFPAGVLRSGMLAALIINPN